MKYFYELVKTIYFVATVLVGVFFLRWSILIPNYYEIIIQYIIPGYLILCGLMIGYIISKMRISFLAEESRDTVILQQWFILGIVIGLGLGLLYVSL